ncbi:MAG: hypothetical protein KatS3mg089_0449 [Patescibacteria group bacterium]|nr:MAG: hypothetical protein KatS3mg089_0449 [Patescibacteria group bacterium]
MFSRKRLLKKEKKQLTKRRLLFTSIVLGVLGVGCIVVGTIMLLHEPLFISPLPVVGSPLPSNEDQYFKKTIQTKLKEYAIPYESISIPRKSLFIIKLSDGGEVVLTSRKDLIPQLSSLQVIYSRLTMEGKKFRRLDMRYDKPIILLQ